MRNLLCALAAGVFALSACSSDDATGPQLQPDDVSLTVQSMVAGTGVSAMTLEVTGPGIPMPITTNLTISAGVATGTLDVPAGSDRTFTVRAFDGNALETHRGTVTAAVRGGMNPMISISLTTLTGDLPIIVTMGAYAVTLSPDTATVGSGDALGFTALVTAADGNVVESPDLLWASENPIVASVDSSGQAVGGHPGSTTITATFGGAVGTAALVVQ